LNVLIPLGGNANESAGNDDVLLQSLPYASGAKFNAYARPDNEMCHHGTRVALLDKIMAWMAAHDARHVFWLNGMAGTGKSTIVRTVARRCANVQRLGASFFFTRSGGDLASARKFVTTIAVQLATVVPALRPHICAAVRSVRDVAAMALQDQWARLALQPLARASGGFWRQLLARNPLVIVVDALDECERDSETAVVLGLLALGATSRESWLRVLLTSRPETPIRYGADSIPQASLARLVLHPIDPPVVNRDISIYLTGNLRRIGKDFLRNSNWPSLETIERLVKQAGSLFIWAATAYRFIHSGGPFANNRLHEVLAGASDDSTPENALDRVYLTVLNKAVRGTYREAETTELCAALYSVISTIAVLAAPLDGHSLADLALTSSDAITKALHRLPSILDIPDNPRSPIRLHRAAFCDLVTHRCADVRFAVDEKLQHNILAERCL
jgi:hypothetical protein